MGLPVARSPFITQDTDFARAFALRMVFNPSESFTDLITKPARLGVPIRIC